MGRMTVTPCPLEGLFLLEPAVYEDGRGSFMETYNKEDLRAAGLDAAFVQDNQSLSARGVLRGLHYQALQPQGKLVRVIRGAVFDVAVDLRPHSPTYGRWFGQELSAENKKQIYLPEGFAHGFLALSREAEVFYKVTAPHCAAGERGIRWNDPKIGVSWPLGAVGGEENLILSEKDKQWPLFAGASG